MVFQIQNVKKSAFHLIFLKEPEGISNQAPKENQALTSKVLKEIVDAPFENFNEHYFQGSCKKQFDGV